MGNPFGGKAKASSKSKFKAITGKSGGGQQFGGDKQGSPAMAKTIKSGGDEVPAYGGKGKGRLDKFARGGSVKKGTTTVNIAIVSPSKGNDEAPPPPLMPPMPPPGAGPGGPPPGIMAPMTPPPDGPPGPPLMRAAGGRLPTAGAYSGVGRLQKAKLAKKSK